MDIAVQTELEETDHDRRRIPFIPWGVRFLRYSNIHRPRFIPRLSAYRVTIFLLTYAIYISYHIIRRPLSVVKNVLRQNCSHAPNDTDWHNWTSCAWEPFDKNSQTEFSILDFVYRLSFAFGVITTGYIAERSDLRNFLTCGMFAAGFWTIVAGLAYFWRIHVFSFFVIIQILAGAFQGTGLPCVVALVGHWFGGHRVGLLFGVWNTHTSVGNILGSILAGVWVNGEWGYSFVVPGILICALGIVNYLFVVVHPSDVGLVLPSENPKTTIVELYGKPTESVVTSVAVEDHKETQAIGLWQVLKVPGVIEYACCLFFNKAAFYTFFFWLPVYIKDATDAANHIAADLSAVFDGGGIIGGVLAGFLSDRTSGSATVCAAMFVLAIPSLFCLERYASYGTGVLVGLLIVNGLFINGPYTLISTAIPANLGSRVKNSHNSHALPTTVGIIDGLGSLGSAFGPLVAGLLSNNGWRDVFYFLMACQVAAILSLTRLIYQEALQLTGHRRSKNSLQIKNDNVLVSDLVPK